MADLRDLLPVLCRDLERIGCRYALVGGIAVTARARPRLTRDADVAIAAKDDTDAEAIVQSLLRLKYRALAVMEHGPSGRLATVRMRMPESSQEGADADLLFASSGIEREIVDDAQPIEVLGVLAPVARRGHLIALKLLARNDDARPNDRADLLALLAACDGVDLADARHAIALITDRGFNRERDLAAALDEFVRVSGRGSE